MRCSRANLCFDTIHAGPSLLRRGAVARAWLSKGIAVLPWGGGIGHCGGRAACWRYGWPVLSTGGPDAQSATLARATQSADARGCIRGSGGGEEREPVPKRAA